MPAAIGQVEGKVAAHHSQPEDPDVRRFAPIPVAHGPLALRRRPDPDRGIASGRGRQKRTPLTHWKPQPAPSRDRSQCGTRYGRWVDDSGSRLGVDRWTSTVLVSDTSTVLRRDIWTSWPQPGIVPLRCSTPPIATAGVRTGPSPSRNTSWLASDHGGSRRKQPWLPDYKRAFPNTPSRSRDTWR